MEIASCYSKLNTHSLIGVAVSSTDSDVGIDGFVHESVQTIEGQSETFQGIGERGASDDVGRR